MAVSITEGIFGGAAVGAIGAGLGVLAGKIAMWVFGLTTVTPAIVIIGSIVAGGIGLVSLAVVGMAMGFGNQNDSKPLAAMALSILAAGALTASFLTGYKPGQKNETSAKQFNEACRKEAREVKIDGKTYVMMPQGCDSVSKTTAPK